MARRLRYTQAAVHYRRQMKEALTTDQQRGVRMRAAREAANLTLQGVANRIGVDKSTVWKWEHGQHRADDKHIEALSKLYGVTPEHLMFGVNPSDDTEHEAFGEFLLWLKTATVRDAVQPWMTEALRTAKIQLPPETEPTLETYKQLLFALFAVKSAK